MRRPLRIRSGQLAVVRSDDRTHNGETHAQPVAFGGKELLENLLRFFRGQPSAKIAHTHSQATVGFALAADDYATLSHRRLTHRLEGIHDEIEQYLLKLHLICLDQWQLRI